jgi:hypothetical protein
MKRNICQFWICLMVKACLSFALINYASIDFGLL